MCLMKVLLNKRIFNLEDSSILCPRSKIMGEIFEWLRGHDGGFERLRQTCFFHHTVSPEMPDPY